jgi:hypothetical protein
MKYDLLLLLQIIISVTKYLLWFYIDVKDVRIASQSPIKYLRFFVKVLIKNTIYLIFLFIHIKIHSQIC